MRESDNRGVSVIAEDGCDWYWFTGTRMARHDMCCDDLYTRLLNVPIAAETARRSANS